MVLRSLRIALEWLVALVAGVALLAAAGLFWLSREPLPVDFVEPYIEAALSSGDGITVDVGETQLVWAGWGSRIEVAAQDWTVHGADGRRLLTIPSGSVELSLSALLDGQIAPTAITLRGLRISLLRRADGRFALGREQPSEAAEDAEPEIVAAEQSVFSAVFSPLADRPDPGNPFAQLASVSVAEASAVLVDRRLGAVWRAPFVNLAIRRDPHGVSATGSATVALGERRSRLDLTMTQVAGTPGLEAVVDIDSLEPAALAAVLPEAQPLEALSGSLTGRLGLTLAEDGRPTAAVAELSGEALTLELPERLEQPLVFRDLVLQAHSEGLDKPLVLDALTGSVAPAGREEDTAAEDRAAEDRAAGPSFSLRAIAEPSEALLEVALTAELHDLPAADIGLYWPKGVGGNGRAWVVENITAGRAGSATLSSRLALDRDSHALREIRSFGGRFLYEDLEVHYLRPLPPLTGVTGSAAYDLAGLDFTIAEARTGDIELGSGAVSVFGLEGDDHRLSIAFDAAGPLRQALELLDHERLGLLGNLGIEPSSAAGRFEARASFAFPLIGALTFEEVELGVDGQVADAALKGGVAGYDLEDGGFELAVDAEGLSASGEARVAGIPLNGTWRESFQAVERPTRVEARVPSVTVEELAAFGLEGGEHASGPLSADLDIEADHRGNARIGLTANLEQLSARVPMVGWEKPAGRPGRLQAELIVRKGALARVDGLAAESGDDAARGEIVMAPGGGVERVTFQALAFGRNSVTDLTVTPFLDDGWSVSVRSGVLDLAPLLGTRPEDRAQEAPAAAEAERAEGPPYLPLRLEAPALSRVRLARGRALEGVSLELERRREGWRLIRAQARIPRELWRHENRPVPEDAQLAEKSMKLDYWLAEEGGYRFELFADDIGATLRALGWVESIEGGSGEIVGRLPGPLPDAPLDGRIETKGFRVVEAPAMAKLLTVASLTGIGNLLSGEGIEFDRAVGRFTLDDETVTTPLFRAYGSSLGITAKGRMDLEGADTDISGTLVPAYSVNRILGEIPILGRILTGGEGEGILGVTYRVTGEIEDPEVSVNPLSILAPGFLRGLFGVPRGDGGEAEELTDVFPSGEVGR